MSDTTLSNLIDPEVMADSISADLPAKLQAKGFVKVNTDLSARAGDTITVPHFNYIGPAADLAEGVEGSVDQLNTNSKQYAVKKAVKNVELTDEAVLSGYGDPVGETNKQLRMSIMDKIDDDCMSELEDETGVYRISEASAALSYDIISEAMLHFGDEEEGIETYLLVSLEGLADLRKDTKFLSNEQIASGLLKTGVVGSIAGAMVVPCKKLFGVNDTRNAYLLRGAAITAFLKRDVNLETARNVLAKKTLISADEHYTVAIEDGSKVIGITHKNTRLGAQDVQVALMKQSDGTYDVKISLPFPAVQSVNSFVYKLGTSIAAVAYDDALTTGWTTAASFPVTLTDVGATPILSMAQIKTADTKAKYFGFKKLL